MAMVRLLNSHCLWVDWFGSKEVHGPSWEGKQFPYREGEAYCCSTQFLFFPMSHTHSIDRPKEMPSCLARVEFMAHAYSCELSQ